MGMQIAELFCECLFFDLAWAADRAAETLAPSVVDAGYSLHAGTQTYQVLTVPPMPLIARMQQKIAVYIWENINGREAVVQLLQLKLPTQLSSMYLHTSSHDGQQCRNADDL